MTSPTSPAAAQTPLTATSDAVRGKFVWYDLMTPDVEAALAFYGAVVGWTADAWQGPEGTPPYRMLVDAKGARIGGVMGLSPAEVEGGAPTLWLPYIGAPDVDATHAEALSLGAREFVPPRDIPTVGRFSVLADPQGAGFALFAPTTAGGQPTPSGDAVGDGDVSWHELPTSDANAAWTFYSRLFGWEKTEAMDMGPAGVYQMFGQGGRTFGGLYSVPGARPHWLVYLRVPDVHAAVAAVRANGGTVNREPMEVPGGNVVVDAQDPWGAAFGLDQKPAS